MRDAESEMDEDEWTDRNFGASAAEGSSDDLLEMSDSEEENEEEMEEALMTADETRQAAERWTRKHSGLVFLQDLFSHKLSAYITVFLSSSTFHETRQAAGRWTRKHSG